MQFWIASYPRSGNTYLRILLRNRHGIVSLPTPSRRPATRTIADTSFVQPYHRDEGARADIEGEKTHAPPPSGDSRPAVYLVRDGRDALVSYAHYVLAFVHNCPFEDVTNARLRATLRNLIVERNSQYKTWSENVREWSARPNTLVIRYEELVESPAPVTDRVVAALAPGLPVVSEAIPSFGDLKSSDPRFFRKGQRGSWEELFTPELHELFWKYNGATMTRFGYSRGQPLRASA